MKKLLEQVEFELKEAKYQINKLTEKELKLVEENHIITAKCKEMVADLSSQLEKKTKMFEDRNQIAIFECDKIIKTLTTVYKTVFDGHGNAPKTTKQLLDKASRDAAQLKECLISKTLIIPSEERKLEIGNVIRNNVTTVSRENATKLKTISC